MNGSTSDEALERINDARPTTLRYLSLPVRGGSGKWVALVDSNGYHDPSVQLLSWS